MKSELGRIVDALPGLVWTAFPDGGMDFLSQRWFDVTGLGVDECCDRGWQIAVHPEDLPRLLAGWRTDSALGTPVETEARLRGSNGEYRWFLFRAVPSVDASGRVVKWRGLSIDIDERKQAEGALREEQKRAEALLAGERRLLEMIARGRPVADILEALCRFVESTVTGSYCGVMLLDPSGKNLQEAFAPSIASEFNASARGWPLNRIRGPNVMAARDNIQVIMRDIASDARWRNGWRALVEKHGLSSCCSTPIVSQAGKVLGTLALYWSEPGNPSPLQLELIERFTHVASISIELAQRDAALRQSESRLTTAEHELQSMIDTIPAYVAAYEPDGTRSFVNQTWQDYMGLTREEATGTAAKSFPHFHPDDAEMNDRAWQASLASGEPLSIEVRVRRADGQYRWHTSQRVPLRDENGKIVRWYSVGIDIDDRKSAEEALRRSEARLAEIERELQLTIDSIPALVATYRPDGSRIFVNQTWRDYTGLSLEDAARTSIVHPDDAARVAQQWGTSLAAGAPLKTEARLRRADGEYRWHAVHRVLARDEAGAIVKMYNVAVDIEERKRAEEALHASEQSSRLIVDGIPGLVAVLTPNGEFEFVNRQIVEYFGKTLDDLKLKRWGARDGVHPEDRPRVTAAFKQSIASGDPFDFELRCKRSDGVYRWFQSRGFPLRDADGHIVRWYNLLIDINERKCAEEALRQSEARLAEAKRELRLTLDSIPVITWRGAANGYVQQLNRRWFEYTGTTPEQVRGRRWKSCVHPDDLEPLVDAGTKYVAAGVPVDCEARLRRFDGVYRWFLFRPAPAHDDSGNIVAWYGTITDIEDRKSAEEKAFEAERNLKLTVDTIPALAWSARPDGSAEFFNQQYLDYLGFPAEQALGWGWAAAVHPDDLSGLMATWQSLLASGGPGEAEARLRRHDGEYRWFLFRATPLFHRKLKDRRTSAWLPREAAGRRCSLPHRAIWPGPTIHRISPVPAPAHARRIPASAGGSVARRPFVDRWGRTAASRPPRGPCFRAY